MAHDEHFLSRLERVTPAQVDLALSLYKDPRLVQDVLARAALPADDRHARVAIALDAGERAPHLVVARDGGFVTCLGPGMSVGQLPVISKARLDAVSSQVAELRRRLESARLVRGEDVQANVARLFVDVLERGSDVSRETISGLLGFHPLVADHAMAIFEKFRAVVTKTRTLAHRGHPLDDAMCAAYWRALWGCLHLQFVLYQSERAYLEAMAAQPDGAHLGASLACDGPWVAGSLRGAWILARNADLFLGPCKRAFREATASPEAGELRFTLVAMAGRQAKHVAEVEKALRGDDPVTRFAREQLPALLEGTGAALRATFELAGEPFSTVLPPGPLSPAEMVGHLALLECHPMASPRLQLSLLAAAPHVGRAAPEELYLPRAVLAGLRPTDPARQGRALLAQYVEDSEVVPAVATGPKIGRNDPCHCGSGKKFKKCHGA